MEMIYIGIACRWLWWKPSAIGQRTNSWSAPFWMLSGCAQMRGGYQDRCLDCQTTHRNLEEINSVHSCWESECFFPVFVSEFPQTLDSWYSRSDRCKPAMSQCNLLSGDVICYLDFGFWEVMQRAAGGKSRKSWKWMKIPSGFLRKHNTLMKRLQMGRSQFVGFDSRVLTPGFSMVKKLQNLSGYMCLF